VLRRDHQRPSKCRERGRSRRLRGSPRPGNWTTPGCGAKRSSLLTAEGGQRQRAAGSSARARSQARGGVPHGATASSLHRRRSLRTGRTRA
jgi:hypothetical protein